MLMDKRTEFCSATVIGGSTGRRLLGDVIDLENQRDIGSTDNVWLVVQVATTFTSGGAGTLQIELATDAAAAIAVDGSATEHITSATFALAALTAGTTLVQQLLPNEGDTPYERYLGIIGNVGSNAMTAGAINAFLTTQPPNHKAYPDGRR